MEQARAIPAHDLRRGTAAAAQPQEPARPTRGPVKTLGTGKSLVELQRRFAEQAKASARHMVEKQARNAGDQGKFVEQANLLNKAGATTEARATMLWQGALDTLRLPGERISSRWLGTEALMLASAPYKSTKELTEDLQLAAVKRLLPNIDQLPDDEALADAVLDVREVYEDTVYAVAHDVIAILKRYAEVDKAVSGKADLPLLSVLQSIREHIATLVYPGFIGKTPPDALPSIERYLHADLLRLTKAKNDKNRDVRWAWEADEAKQLADNTMAKAQREPAGPRHETGRDLALDARGILRIPLGAGTRHAETDQPATHQKGDRLATSQNPNGLFRFFKPVNSS